MKKFLDHKEHYLRLVAIVVVGLAAFLVIRTLAIPKDFGKYGHFRPGAIDDNAAKPMKFAGHRACLDCHSDVAEKKGKGSHAEISCETCHGPLADHVALQTEGKSGPAAKPERPKVDHLCLGCHRVLIGRPAIIRQIDPKNHNDGNACNECHDVHSPKLGGDEPAATAAPGGSPAPAKGGAK